MKKFRKNREEFQHLRRGGEEFCWLARVYSPEWKSILHVFGPIKIEIRGLIIWWELGRVTKDLEKQSMSHERE